MLYTKSLKQKNRYIKGFYAQKNKGFNKARLMDALVSINSYIKNDGAIKTISSQLKELVGCNGISFITTTGCSGGKTSFISNDDNYLDLKDNAIFISSLLKKLDAKKTPFTTSLYSMLGLNGKTKGDFENYSMLVFPLLRKSTRELYGGIVFYRLHIKKFSLRDVEEFQDFIALLSGMIEEIICDKSNDIGKMEYDKYVLTAQLAAGVAHEINNPLQVIAGNAQLALKKLKDDSPLKRHLKTIIDESFYCKEITRSLIDFSEELEFIKHKIDLNKFMEKMVDKFHKIILSESITLETCYSSNLNKVEIEKGSFSQVIYHIITNAIQALETKNDKRIKIVTRNIPEDNLVEIQISDNGCGMDKETLKLLYTPFFTTREQGSGKGLGLSISYGIIQRHRGTISVNSEPGIGTSFFIKLPAILG